MHNETEEILKETKTKYAIYLYPSQMEQIKSLMDQANAKSQSEFVSDAIRFYIGYLQQGKNVDYLAPIIAQAIKEEIKAKFGEYANPSFESQVETVSKARTGGVMSIRTAVDEMYGDSKDEEWKNEEERRIKEENGIAVLAETSALDDVTV